VSGAENEHFRHLQDKCEKLDGTKGKQWCLPQFPVKIFKMSHIIFGPTLG